MLYSQKLHMAQDASQQPPSLSTEIPLNSSFERIYLRFSTSFIDLNFGRPNVNGRKIFGNLVPYDHVWRAGADWSTEINFGEDIIIEGKFVTKGKYEIHSIPRKDQAWDIYLTKEAWSWEKFDTTPPKDAIVFKIYPNKLDYNEETLLYYFSNVTNRQAVLNLRWDNILINLKITTISDHVAIDKIDEIMRDAKSEDNKPFFAAAQYYYMNNLDLEQALKWSQAEITRQMTYEKPHWWTFLLHGRILSKLNHPIEAKKYFLMAIEKLEGRKFYIETILKKELENLQHTEKWKI